jgi:hypothetical protein
MSQPQFPPPYTDWPARESGTASPNQPQAVPIQAMPFSEPYTLARDLAQDGDPQPFAMASGPQPKKSLPRWIVGVSVLAVVMVVACVGAFVAVGFGAKSVSDEINRDSKAAVADVKISRCAAVRVGGIMAASITITNHGSAAASYVVDVGFDSVDGARQIDTGVASATALAAGETTTVQASGGAATVPSFTCKVIGATRY